MSSDVFRRVGRGGAGNFLSKKDIDGTSKTQSEDLEAQKPANPPPLDPSAGQSGPVYTRAGRGGAGNFYDPASLADAHQQERDEAERARAAVSAGMSKHKAALTGRGGLGNWTDAAPQTPTGGGDEKRKAEALEAKILQDVEAGLKMPAPAYHQHDRVVE